VHEHELEHDPGAFHSVVATPDELLLSRLGDCACPHVDHRTIEPARSHKLHQRRRVKGRIQSRKQVERADHPADHGGRKAQKHASHWEIAQNRKLSAAGKVQGFGEAEGCRLRKDSPARKADDRRYSQEGRQVRRSLQED
jgi:hypothetical protein